MNTYATRITFSAPLALPALVALGSSTIYVPPQLIYQLAYENALRQLAAEKAQQEFHRNQILSNN